MISNVFVGICILLVFLLVLIKFEQREKYTQPSRDDEIRNLARQAFRWYVASTQDSNPMIKGLHADYAVAYADILKNMATKDEILRVTSIDIDEFMKSATHQQDAYLVEIAKRCPDLLPQDAKYRKYINSFLVNN